MKKEETINKITDFLNSIEDIECYMYMIRGLIEEDIKLTRNVEIAQIREFVNSFYFLAKEIEDYSKT